jgi:hypothetical protein
MNQNEEEVLLLQYDLTDGKATKFYKFMTGKDLEAIWHTSLVVYGREYYFGGGICKGMPRATPYGYPIKESVFGKTTKTKKEFEDYLKTINDEFSEHTYHMLDHNCNHFTHAICQFLCNKPLPDEILNQHKVVLDTEFGKWFIPKLEKMAARYSSQVPSMLEGSGGENN